MFKERILGIYVIEGSDYKLILTTQTTFFYYINYYSGISDFSRLLLPCGNLNREIIAPTGV